MRALWVFIAMACLSHPVGAFAENWPAYSAEKAGSPELHRCLGANPSSVEEGECLSKDYARENRRMEAAFAESMKGSSAAEKVQRTKAQQAWKTFRRENCAVRGLNPGSGMAIFYFGCLVRETITRRTELTDNWDY